MKNKFEVNILGQNLYFYGWVGGEMEIKATSAFNIATVFHKHKIIGGLTEGCKNSSSTAAKFVLHDEYHHDEYLLFLLHS